MSDDHRCPECGTEIDDVRVTCSKCGYEYKASDYDDTEAGSEFTAGVAVDDEGNETVSDTSATQN